jgi:hypothetical protein
MRPLKTSSGYHDDFLLSTGKEISANCSILGISPELELHEGYDGTIDEAELTPKEKLEIAEYAISLWQKYKDKIKKEKSYGKNKERSKDRNRSL